MLAHDLALLGWDAGWSSVTERRCAYAAALLWELEQRDQLVVAGAGLLGLRGEAPTEGALAVTAKLFGWTNPAPYKSWIHRLMRRSGKVEAALLADLASAGVLGTEPRRILGIPLGTRYVLARPEVRADVIARVRAAADAPMDEAPTPDEALLGLVRSAKLLPVVWPSPAELEAARPRIEPRTARIPLGREAATTAREIQAAAAGAASAAAS